MLTEKKKRFAELYLANPNATQAAIDAGYSKNTAGSQGQRLLKDVDIRALVEKRLKKFEIDADEVLGDLKTIKDNLDEKTTDRLKALELLGKHLKLFTDKIEATGANGGPIETTATININGVPGLIPKPDAV